MDWESTLSAAVGTAITIIATGTVTLLGVWLKGRYDLAQQRVVIDAENARAAIEREQAKELTDATRTEHTNEARRANADRALDTLAEILEGLSELPDNATFRAVEERWNRDFDARARRVVELLSDSDTREDMLFGMDMLANFKTYADANGLTEYGGWNGRLKLHLMIELAGTSARGEPRSSGLAERVAEQDRRYLKLTEYTDGLSES